MLTPREAFKVGFLRRCADSGLSVEETHQAVKQAMEMVKSAVVPQFISDIGKDAITAPYRAGTAALAGTASTLGNYGLGALLLGPAALGAAGGYGLSRLTDIDDTDVDAIKKRELIDEYYRQIDLLRSKRRGVYKRPPGPHLA